MNIAYQKVSLFSLKIIFHHNIIRDDLGIIEFNTFITVCQYPMTRYTRHIQVY